MTARTYNSPKAFKEALEQRLRSASKNGVDFARRRQLLVFDRFLARVVAVLRDTVLLKGGLVLELRLERARTTKDIDLRLTGSPETVLADLQEAGRQVLGDFMAFEVSRDAEQPWLAVLNSKAARHPSLSLARTPAPQLAKKGTSFAPGAQSS